MKVINKSRHALPAYSTDAYAGIDLRANIEKNVIIKSMKRTLIRIVLFIEMPEGHEAQIRSRSGLEINKGVIILNSPGTIDSDYRGEV